MTYEKMLVEVARMKAECYCWDQDAERLPANPSPAQEAEALLFSNDPPRGEDAALCQAIIHETWKHAE